MDRHGIVDMPGAVPGADIDDGGGRTRDGRQATLFPPVAEWVACDGAEVTAKTTAQVIR